jgi:peptidoglycan/LPS O-acetylase OafA/YrhL
MPGPAMTRVARIARYVGILCIAGMVLTISLTPVGDPVWFFVLMALLVCFLICVPIVTIQGFREYIALGRRSLAKPMDYE